MRIDKIEIDGFGKLHNVFLEFSSGFHLILGDNESGKSTICEFLLAMFYELPNDKKTAGSYENGRAKYRPWTGDAFGGRVYFTDNDGTKYLLEKTFGKTRNSDRAKLLYADTWESAGTAENAGERFFGLGREGFIKTLYVKSLDANSQVGSAEILSRLSNMETGADEDISYDRIKAAMEKAHGQIITKTGRGGKLPALYEEKRALEMEKAQLLRKRESVRITEQQAETLAKKAEALQEQEQKLEDLFRVAKEHEAYLAVKQAENSRSVLSARYKAECQKLAEAKANLAVLEEQATLSLDEADILQAERLEKQTIIAESKLEEWKKQQEQQKESQAKQSRKLREIVPCACVLGAVLLSSIFFFINSVISIVMLCLGLLSGILAFVLMGKPKQKKDVDNTPNPEEEIIRIQQETEALCKKYSVPTLEAFQMLVRGTYDAQKYKAKALEDIKYLEVETEQILKSISDIRIPELPHISLEAESYEGDSSETIHEKIQQVNKEQENVKETLHTICLELAKETAGERSVSQVETEHIAVVEEIETLEKQDAAFRQAEIWLEKAHREIKENFAPRLNQKTAEIFSMLTDGKYNEVRVGEAFNLQYKNEAGEITQSGNLSCGTYDLLYISQRLASLMTLFGEKVPPLILDDAFMQFDDKRYQKAMAYLSTSEAFEQVLSFTCHREMVQLLKKENIHFIDLNKEGVLGHELQD